MRLALSAIAKHAIHRLLLSGLLLVCVIATPCWATLGGNQDSISRDSAQLKGTARVIQAQTYLVHEIRTSAGQTVREFVSPDGLVFAVSWRGPGLFDLRQILGDHYFEQYKQAISAAHSRGNTPVSLQTPGFVFRLAGTIGALHGQAYIPTMTPAHFNFNATSALK